MAKKLSEMTLKELWELFSIKLTEHNVCWKEYYAEDAAELIFPIISAILQVLAAMNSAAR